jgi:hypothetical protein
MFGIWFQDQKTRMSLEHNRNKSNEQGEVVTNNARLVAKGYCHQESLVFIENFAHVAKLETIRLVLSYDC